MKQIIKDNINIAYLSVSIILLGSIGLSLLKPLEQETIIETEIYTVDDTEIIDIEMFNTYINKVDQIEIDIKLLKNALYSDNLPEPEKVNPPIVEVVEKEEDGSSTVTWPPKFRLNFKSPSSKEKP